MDISVQFEGLDDLAKQMERMTTLAKQRQLTQNALFYASKPMLDEVKKQAPKAEKAYYRYYRGSASSRLAGNPQGSRVLKKPGTLRKNITRQRVRLADGSVGVGILVKNKAFYWRFLEYGTPNMVAVPFLRPAFDHNKEDAVERFKERYREYLQKIIEHRQLESGGANAGE
ncbi:HK97-gp10 family putative phage morphogenesis protein [Acinetobacter sp. ANC 4641]|uniref:HK97-gp10 family putative phage morphogenesis protein n=1 Tax=Acinetobacter sp. ANC 4641 TaxID=2529847 RepID=UPI00103A4B24|nr:HK97-gp10 family putative phage morphogenesis protein [Acinetobacter sp. ANC 4641]TCB09587.1 hypothetical protein E0H78_10685 [Acinetobacter sp. ANC 4641]